MLGSNISSQYQWTLGVAIASGGGLISVVLLVLFCVCCRSNVPQHKAKVVKNVVAEEDLKSTLPAKRGSMRPRPRPSSMIFENKVVGTGKWCDFSHIAEEADDIPMKFRVKKPERPPNPPDVILHPSIRNTLLAAQRREIRPRSTIVRGTAANPQTVEHYSSQINDSKPGPNNGSLKEVKTRPKSEYPLREFGNQPDVVESVQKKVEVNKHLDDDDVREVLNNIQSPSRDESRDHTQSSPKIQTEQYPVTTPSKRKEGDYKVGAITSPTHQQIDEDRWGDDESDPQGEKPPPLPTRRYLLYKQESEPNMMEDGAWQMGQRPEIANQSTKSKQNQPLNVDDLKKLPGYHHNSPHQGRLPHSPPNQHSPPTRRSHRVRNQESPNRAGESPRRGNSHHDSPRSTNAYMRGSDNLAFERETDPARNYRNNPALPDQQQQAVKLRERSPQYENRYGNPDHPVQLHHQRVRCRGFDDVIHEHPFEHQHLAPGIYSVQKTYYMKGMPGSSKRYSDASDYSDYLFRDSSFYVDRVGNDDPYFFRSRWSAAPDTKPEELFARRRNSDFHMEHSNSEVPLGSYPNHAPPGPRGDRRYDFSGDANPEPV